MSCCAVYLAFGFVAGAAHVHEAADHHDEMRGLHLDHDHLGESSGLGSTCTRQPVYSDDGGAHLDARHIGHHEGDVLYLTVTAQRLLNSGLRVLPAIVAVGETIDRPALVSVRRNELPDQLRGPPSNGSTPPRAPPA